MASIGEDENPYYFAYNIVSKSLNNSDINKGLMQSLEFAKIWFDVDNVILYKLDESGDNIHLYNQVLKENNSSITDLVLNSTKKIIEDRKFYQMDLSINDLESVLLIPIVLDNARYVVTMTSKDKKISVDENNLDLFIESMSTVLNNFDKINNLKNDAELDALTGLDNRFSYEKVIEKQPRDGLVYVLFDLFRLKTINDNYSHDLGDKYITKTAEVLKKHFPKYISEKDSNGSPKKNLTGSCLYRIGGDEFVLISESEPLENIQAKILIAQEEVKNINLNINEPLVINCGLAVKENDETFKDLYLQADGLLSENKKETYKVLGLERRKH